MIVSIFALKDGQLRLVQVSLIGSILSNLLLVLGTAFFVGGLRHPVQTYSKPATHANSGLLMLAVTALLFAAILKGTGQGTADSQLPLARIGAFGMLILYGLLVFYQLKTHRYLFEAQEEDGDDEDDAPVLGLQGSICWMLLVTVCIALASEMLVSTLESASEQIGIPSMFIGMILLPIVGNAAEHSAAIIFAYKNKLDIALGISMGSATQISLFVIPFMVILGWIIGQDLTLDFALYESAVTFLTVFIVSFATHSGESDWLKGVMLIMVYFIMAVSFWVHLPL